MSAHNPEAPVDPIKSAPRTSEEIVVQVRAEFARFIEKRDAIRKSTGKLRRTLLHTLLA